MLIKRDGITAHELAERVQASKGNKQKEKGEYIMKQVVNDSNLVAFCGLYCGACRAYLKEKCPGCRENTKATWCKLRTCCLDNKYGSCADCKDYKEVNDCKKFNNLISKIFAIVFRSNRKACIEQIREKGMEKHAEIMASMRSHTLKR